MRGPARRGAAAVLDPGIRVVELVLTTRCNLRCRYCDQGRIVSRSMAPDVLDEAVRRLMSSRLKRPKLTLYGGEPLLAASLVKRALGCVRAWAPSWMEPDVRILTNGTRLDEETFRLLTGRDVHVTLSFDGVPAAQDERSPGSFEALDRLLIRWRHDRPAHFRERFAVKMTLTPKNVPHLAASFRYFLSRGIRDVEIAPAAERAAPWTRRQAGELDRQLAEVARLSMTEVLRSGRIPLRALRPCDAPPRAPREPACGCGNHGVLFVDVDGRVAPCAAFVPSVLPDRAPIHGRIAVALGGIHVSDPDLPEKLLLRERRARRLRSLRRPADRPGWSPRCARCPARETCLVCPAAIALTGGRVPDFHCDVNRLLAGYRARLGRVASDTALTARPRHRQGRGRTT